MFVYEKKLQYPVRIANPNPKLAAVIISQYGGPYSNKLCIRSNSVGQPFCASLARLSLLFLLL